MKSESHINIFHQLVRCSPVAEKLQLWFSQRGRGASVTKVRVASWHTGLAYNEIVALFKLLEALGFGIFIEGRHGNESRIAWNVDMRRVSKGI